MEDAEEQDEGRGEEWEIETVALGLEEEEQAGEEDEGRGREEEVGEEEDEMTEEW